MKPHLFAKINKIDNPTQAKKNTKRTQINIRNERTDLIAHLIDIKGLIKGILCMNNSTPTNLITKKKWPNSLKETIYQNSPEDMDYLNGPLPTTTQQNTNKLSPTVYKGNDEP